ncbi:hypothetical protein DFH06DRAFT_1326746 [Mycena polygramma]|nr:hypothetical protein DFH06DRAFT_1326746 [Mycena polygramma]
MLVMILRVLKIQGVMIGEVRLQTYVSMYSGPDNEYDPDVWQKANLPFDHPTAGTGRRVCGWSVDAESASFIEGFVQDELLASPSGIYTKTGGASHELRCLFSWSSPPAG